MSFEIKYEGSRMVLPVFECSCGCTHNRPETDVYIGSGILGQCPGYIKGKKLGYRAVLVADNITYEIAGRTVEGRLREEGFDISLCLLEREGMLEPDEAALGEVLLTMDSSTEFFISVGSGSVTDIVRYVAFNTGRPFVCIGTAPSMDGYASAVAPLLFKGLKVNKPAVCPQIIICDLDILKNAPPEMFISGVGDVLGKYVAKADWILGNVVNGEKYCPVCAELVMQAVGKCADNIDEIKSRSSKGTQYLTEALILAGITVMVIGSTRAVASIEHNMAHYWEMMKLAAGERAPSHGTAVGVGTVYSLMAYKLFLKIDTGKVDIQALKRDRLSRGLRQERMVKCYGERIGSAIMAENPEDFLEWEEHLRRVEALKAGWKSLKEQLHFLPGPEEISGILVKLGAPVSAAELGIDEELLEQTLMCSKDYRSRYNVCKSLHELGMLDETIKNIMAKLSDLC